MNEVRSGAQVGDRLEVHGTPGKPTRRGEIVEVLGNAGHEHYLVRWESDHESIVYPAEGVNVIHNAASEHA